MVSLLNELLWIPRTLDSYIRECYQCIFYIQKEITSGELVLGYADDDVLSYATNLLVINPWFCGITFTTVIHKLSDYFLTTFCLVGWCGGKTIVYDRDLVLKELRFKFFRQKFFCKKIRNLSSVRDVQWPCRTKV